MSEHLLWSWEAHGAWVKDGQRRTWSWGATGWLPPRGPALSPTHGGVSVLRGNVGAEFESLQGSLGQTPEGRPATHTPMPGLGSCRHLGEELAGRWVGTCSALSPGSCLSGVGGLGLAERQTSWDQEQAGGSPRGPCLCQPLGVYSMCNENGVSPQSGLCPWTSWTHSTTRVGPSRMARDPSGSPLPGGCDPPPHTHILCRPPASVCGAGGARGGGWPSQLPVDLSGPSFPQRPTFMTLCR